MITIDSDVATDPNVTANSAVPAKSACLSDAEKPRPSRLHRKQFVIDVCWAVFFAILAALVLGLLPAIAAASEPDTVLLNFYADWCGPCQAMRPQIELLVRDGYAVQRVNVERDRELAVKYKVTSIPCFVMLEQGREVERIEGSASLEQLRHMYRTAPRPSITKPQQTEPQPAWRYERATGHRAAIVRVYCQDDYRTRSIGSGTLVKWGGRLFILTARHVIKDAKKILVELHTKKTHHARVLAADPTWDCALLEMVGAPEGIEAADLERGEAAMQTAGCRLESCGYGPDGRLACNTGLFQGYRRSSDAPTGPDDWMVVSGHARNGDSGGGVFNARGKLVGVLWGTDGESVVCVQAGRIHKLLNSVSPDSPLVQEGTAKSFVDRSPPLPQPQIAEEPVCSDGCRLTAAAAVQEASLFNAGSTPIRQGCLRRAPSDAPRSPSAPSETPSDSDLRASVRNIDNKLGVLIEQKTTKPAEDARDEASPLMVILCAIAAAVAGCGIYFFAKKE